VHSAMRRAAFHMFQVCGPALKHHSTAPVRRERMSLRRRFRTLEQATVYVLGVEAVIFASRSGVRLELSPTTNPYPDGSSPLPTWLARLSETVWTHPSSHQKRDGSRRPSPAISLTSPATRKDGRAGGAGDHRTVSFG
jgi:hypothetical protein